jgi:hypothetical protein
MNGLARKQGTVNGEKPLLCPIRTEVPLDTGEFGIGGLYLALQSVSS